MPFELPSDTSPGL